MQTVVLLHGLLSDESIWAEQAAGLQGVADVVVPVYRSATSLEEMAGVALGSATGPIAIVGHSMGARVALEMWRSSPERITRIALFDFGVGGPVAGEEIGRRVLTDLSARSGMSGVARQWVGSMVLPDRRGDAGLVEPLHEMVETYTPEEHAGQIRALLGRRDLWGLLATITVPTLVAVGDGDPWRSVEHHRQIAAAIPGAELAVIEECGHMAPAERPEEVTKLIASWLELSGQGHVP